MEDTLITFEIAKLAKEKGFDTAVYYHYTENPVNNLELLVEPDDPQLGQGWKLIDYNCKAFIYTKYSAPTQSLLQKWLREVHNIDIMILPWENTENNTVSYQYFVLNTFDNDEFNVDYVEEKNYDIYEKSLEIGLQEALKLI